MHIRIQTTRGDIACVLRRRRTGGHWHADYHHDGTRYRVGLKTDDYATARQLATEHVLRAVRGVSRARLTLSAAIQQCLDARYPDARARRNHSGFSDAKLRLHRFLVFAGDLNLADLSAREMTGHLQAFFDGLIKEGSSPVSLNNFRRALHRLFSWLLARRLVAWESNPAARALLDLPKFHVSPRAPADPAALDALMAAARACAEAPELYPALVLMQSGFRTVGLTRVTWEDIDLGDRPTVTTTEKGRTRTIPLSTWAAAELRAHAGAGRVWPYSANIVHKYMRQVRKAAGLPPSLTAGAIRRLTYRRLYAAGVSPQLAAKIMGNSVTIALKHYVDLETLDAHEAVENLTPSHPASQNRHTGKVKKKGARS